MLPGWFQNTQWLEERISRPTQWPSLPSTAQSAVCRGWSGMSSPSQGHTGLGSNSDSFKGHSANTKRIYLSQFPQIPYAKLDKDRGDYEKGTFSNFSFSVIWKNSSQFVIIPVLLRCFPPTEHITPARLNGIQGPYRKDSLDFWFNAE